MGKHLRKDFHEEQNDGSCAERMSVQCEMIKKLKMWKTYNEKETSYLPWEKK